MISSVSELPRSRTSFPDSHSQDYHQCNRYSRFETSHIEVTTNILFYRHAHSNNNRVYIHCTTTQSATQLPPP